MGRGSRHTTPSKDADVARVVEMYRAAGVLNREKAALIILGDGDRAGDYVTKGASAEDLTALQTRWWDDRRFQRATTELYSM